MPGRGAPWKIGGLRDGSVTEADIDPAYQAIIEGGGGGGDTIILSAQGTGGNTIGGDFSETINFDGSVSEIYVIAQYSIGDDAFPDTVKFGLNNDFEGDICLAKVDGEGGLTGYSSGLNGFLTSGETITQEFGTFVIIHFLVGGEVGNSGLGFTYDEWISAENDLEKKSSRGSGSFGTTLNNITKFEFKTVVGNPFGSWFLRMYKKSA